MTIANQDLLKALGRANECMRRLIEAGLSFEDLQVPITDPQIRTDLVNYWKNPVRIQELLEQKIFMISSSKFYLKERKFSLKDCIPWENGVIINQNQKVLNYVDLDLILLETGLPDDGNNNWQITINDRIQNLKRNGRIFLDANVFQTLWEDQELIPELWKEKTANGEIKQIVFAGDFFAEHHNYEKDYFTVPRLWFDKEWRKSFKHGGQANNSGKTLFATMNC